jgi:hypothetical protein
MKFAYGGAAFLQRKLGSWPAFRQRRSRRCPPPQKVKRKRQAIDFAKSGYGPANDIDK